MAYKPITDQQSRLHMTDLEKHLQRSSAARAGFSERTARRFDADPTPPSPSQSKTIHGRTVADPIEGCWESEPLARLENDSAVQAVALLRHLQRGHPLAFPDDRSGAPWSGVCGNGGRFVTS